MDEKGLEVFLALAVTKNFRKAADLLNLTQSSVSRRLMDFENQLGNSLFLRHRGIKEVTFTPFGEEVLPLALRWRQINEELATIRNSSNAHEVSLAIGGLDSVKNHILLPFLNEFRKTHPQVKMKLYTGSSTDMYELVSKREVDLAFVQFDLRSTMVKVESFCWEELAVVYNKQFYKQFGATELEPCYELLINWGTNFLRWHDTKWGATNNLYTICDTLFEVRGMMRDTKSWAIVPMSSVEWFLKDEDFAMYKFKVNQPPNRVISMISHIEPRTGSVRAVKELKDILGQRYIQLMMEKKVHFAFAKEE